MRTNILTVEKHFQKLAKVARKRGGTLPTAKWLNEHGYFHSYDVCREYGLLGNFKRASLKRGRKAA